MNDIKSDIGFGLAEILRLKRSFVDSKTKDLNLSRTQWRVLLWMDRLGPCTQKELLTKLEIDAGHLTRVLNPFERNKIIKRESLPEDKRALSIQLTEKGKKTYIHPLNQIISEENTILTSTMTLEEKNTLSTLLAKIKYNLSDHLNKNKGKS